MWGKKTQIIRMFYSLQCGFLLFLGCACVLQISLPLVHVFLEMLLPVLLEGLDVTSVSGGDVSVESLHCHRAAVNLLFLILLVFLKTKESKEKSLMRSIFAANIIIIYRDFLPPPRRNSHVKSDNTHTEKIIKIHPLAHILDT